jgi:L-lactate dehydrogenase (FMN-dependent) and related alpha-hydroxy acid dehydrogenases
VDMSVASKMRMQEVFSGDAHSWEDFTELRRAWGSKPIMLKGLLSEEDARPAVGYRMDEINVSDHGGRQLDGAVASLDVVLEIVETAGMILRYNLTWG